MGDLIWPKHIHFLLTLDFPHILYSILILFDLWHWRPLSSSSLESELHFWKLHIAINEWRIVPPQDKWLSQQYGRTVALPLHSWGRTLFLSCPITFDFLTVERKWRVSYFSYAKQQSWAPWFIWRKLKAFSPDNIHKRLQEVEQDKVALFGLSKIKNIQAWSNSSFTMLIFFCSLLLNNPFSVV